MNGFGLIAFESTHDAMVAEKALREHFAIVLRPTPRKISVACGITIRFVADEADEVSKVLTALIPDSGYQLYENWDE